MTSIRYTPKYPQGSKPSFPGPNKCFNWQGKRGQWRPDQMKKAPKRGFLKKHPAREQFTSSYDGFCEDAFYAYAWQSLLFFSFFRLALRNPLILNFN